MNNYFDVPVALVFFNRPQCFEKVFAVVEKIKPRQLFLIQDGARLEHPTDSARVFQCRLIAENINWKCEVFQNYADANMGCGKRVSSGLDWVFEHVEQAIILEDDCIPDPSFFPYCKELLSYYKHDSRISYISGLNHLEEWDCGGYSYCFTKTGGISGWATWRREWKKFDFYVKPIHSDYLHRLIKTQIINSFVADKRIKLWEIANKSARTGERRPWAAQWGFVKFSQSSLVIVPKCNLIQHVGIGADATHVSSRSNHYVKHKNIHFMPLHKIDLPLEHPSFMICDTCYDQMVFKMECVPLWRRSLGLLKRRLVSIMGRVMRGKNHLL